MNTSIRPYSITTDSIFKEIFSQKTCEIMFSILIRIDTIKLIIGDKKWQTRWWKKIQTGCEISTARGQSKANSSRRNGGQFKPFTENDVTDVIQNIYRILEEIGFSQATFALSRTE